METTTHTPPVKEPKLWGLLAEYPDGAALRAAATALAAAGLPLESAKPDVGHTVFEAADSDASGAPESVHAPQRGIVRVGTRPAVENVFGEVEVFRHNGGLHVAERVAAKAMRLNTSA